MRSNQLTTSAAPQTTPGSSFWLASLCLYVHVSFLSFDITTYILYIGPQPSPSIYVTYPSLASYSHLLDVCTIPARRANQRDGAHHHPCRILPVRTLGHGSPNGRDDFRRAGREWDARRARVVVAHLGVWHRHRRCLPGHVWRLGTCPSMAEGLVWRA
jgi:hypothetical protein